MILNYAKLMKNKLTYAPRNYNTGENLILNFNRNPILMNEYGFKEVVDIKPGYDSSTHYLSVEGYTESDDCITINYKLNKQVIDYSPTLEDRITELERINQELTMLMRTALTKEGE